MKTRIFVIVLSFIFALLYSFPTIAMMFGIALSLYSEYVSALFCMVLAYNLSKLVKYEHDKNKDKCPEKTDWLHGRGFSYTVKDDKVTFTFRGIQDTDGRQVSRLKFIRDQFFKEDDEH